MKLRCDCGNKEFRIEQRNPTLIVDEEGVTVDSLQDGDDPLYFCTKCGEEITPE